MRLSLIARIALTVSAAVSFACGQRAAQSGGIDQPIATGSGDVKFRIEVVASGLEVPWGFAWLPSGDLLFTERPGRVRIIEGGKLRAEPVFVVPDVEPSSESGLMDISLHPDFAKNNFIYLAYAYNSDGKHIKV